MVRIYSMKSCKKKKRPETPLSVLPTLEPSLHCLMIWWEGSDDKEKLRVFSMLQMRIRGSFLEGVVMWFSYSLARVSFNCIMRRD